MNRSITTYFLIFTVSGFSGLIYESIWSHYLKLMLGHAAYAQSLVLMIFMGGMAVGSWIASRKSQGWRRLLGGYAIVEGAIGICALVFHAVFVEIGDFIQFSLIPNMQSLTLINLCKWGTAASLILPQSILLGMTFPLMTGGILRIFPQTPGRSLSTLYFCNSLGAALGVLVSGFYLLKAVGLPGTIMTAGLINLILAVAVWSLSKELETRAPAAARAADGVVAVDSWYLPFLAVALVTGLSSFIYEIAWIRMLSMVLGSATHSFELMLSAFILGLALGGLWIRRRIDAINDVPGFLANVQLLMGGFALGSLVLYGHAFEAMQWLLQALTRTDQGYVLFVLASHGLALAIMLPATFCAGMTLPLVTYTLLQRGVGERSIGAVYAANTTGAIAGVLFTVHFGMPVLGLKNSIVAGAALDIFLGIALLVVLRSRYTQIRLAASATLAVAVLVSCLIWVEFDPRETASGVYRHGRASLSPSDQILVHRDGKTATIDLVRSSDGTVMIATNGKPDAAIAMAAGVPAVGDETTMILAAALPLSLRPQARTAANIGMGSGLTTSTLLASSQLESVDTIEIEAAMVEAARGFIPRVERAYEDPRSRIIIDDAKSFFSSHTKRYDIIVSEPSNPWVSGVANLFTYEFYRLIQNYLTPHGILVQWLQLYEIDVRLLSSVVKSLAREFDNYAVYFADDANILIIASNGAEVGSLKPHVFDEPALRSELDRVAIHDLNDLRLHLIATRHTLDPLFASYPVPQNSDFFPFLDLGAAKSRFLQRSAYGLVEMSYAPLPIVEMLDPGAMVLTGFVSDRPRSIAAIRRNLAKAVLAFASGSGPRALEDARWKTNRDFNAMTESFRFECITPQDAEIWFEGVFRLMTIVLPSIELHEIAPLFQSLEARACFDHSDQTAKRWLDDDRLSKFTKFLNCRFQVAEYATMGNRYVGSFKYFFQLKLIVNPTERISSLLNRNRQALENNPFATL